MIRPNKFEVRSEPAGSGWTVSVFGELDMSTIGLLSDRLAGATQDTLTLDLRGLEFMDSSGLRLLIELNDRARSEGWRLSMIAPTEPSAALVLRVTGADRVLPFEPTS